MRGYFLLVTAILVVPSSLSARSDEIPILDIRPVCRGIASQSADPGIGQGGQAKTFQECIESEQGAFLASPTLLDFAVESIRLA
jgi:hypothetical protein